MYIELHILELKKKDNCPNKEIAFVICGEKKKATLNKVVIFQGILSDVSFSRLFCHLKIHN